MAIDWEEELQGTEEIGFYLSITPARVAQLARAGHLPAVKKETRGSKRHGWCITRRTLCLWAAQHGYWARDNKKIIAKFFEEAQHVPG